MPIASPRYAFTESMVAGAPPDPGVFALWAHDELIYYGRALGDGVTIQSRLREHLASAKECTSRCTSGATHYGWEISGNPRAREAELAARAPNVLRLYSPLQRPLARGTFPAMQWRMDRELRQELYLSLLLLGADPMLLGALETWREGADEQDVLADVRNWNEAKRLEMKEWLATMSGGRARASPQPHSTV